MINLLDKDNRPVSVDIMCIVYNHGKYLRQALDGMLMQETTFPVRIIIHDDASTDDSASIIKAYEKKYPDRIISVIEETNYYQNGKSIWLKMLPYFTSKYIASCEGDDYWTDKRKLQKQVDYLENNMDCVAVYHNIIPVDKNGKNDESLRGPYPVLNEGDYTKRQIKSFSLMTQTATVVYRNFYSYLTDEDKNVYASVQCNGDEKLLILCGLLGRVHYLSDYMAAHRRVLDEGDSWSAAQNKKTRIERILNARRRYIEKCRLYEHFSNKKLYTYNSLIRYKLLFYYYCIRGKESVSEENKKEISSVGIPIYSYILYLPLLIFKYLSSIIRKIRKYINMI